MPSIDHETRNAFNELLVMDGLSQLPVGAILRVLQTLPVPVLAVAVSGALQSPCRDGGASHAASPPPGSR